MHVEASRVVTLVRVEEESWKAGLFMDGKSDLTDIFPKSKLHHRQRRENLNSPRLCAISQGLETRLCAFRTQCDRYQ